MARIPDADIGKKPVRCPDCGLVTIHPDAFDADKPISGICPDCGDRLFFDDNEPVFTNCNVCGIKLRTEAEDQMGMCERCADE